MAKEDRQTTKKRYQVDQSCPAGPSARTRGRIPLSGYQADGDRSLFVITERLHHVEHFFKRDETPAVHQLVAVDGDGQLAGIGRQLFMAVGELAAFAAGG